MQAIQYSSALHGTIRRLKDLDQQEIASLFKDRKFASSLALSYGEKEAIIEVFSKKSPDKPDISFGLWN